MTNEVTAVTNETFEQEVVQSPNPVLVDFYADWCGPCKTVGPIVEELAAEYEGRITVRKVDIDSNPELAHRYGVRSIPTLMVFNGGEAKDTIVGAVPKSRLSEFIDQHAA
jgi:thioredoxin 1